MQKQKNTNSSSSDLQIQTDGISALHLLVTGSSISGIKLKCDPLSLHLLPLILLWQRKNHGFSWYLCSGEKNGLSSGLLGRKSSSVEQLNGILILRVRLIPVFLQAMINDFWDSYWEQNQGHQPSPKRSLPLSSCFWWKCWTWGRWAPDELSETVRSQVSNPQPYVSKRCTSIFSTAKISDSDQIFLDEF